MVDKRVAPPEYASAFSERLIYLPHNYQSTSMPLAVPVCWSSGYSNHRSYSCRSKLAKTLSSQTVVPLLSQHKDALLDPDTIVLCSFNSIKKFEPLSFHSWMNIMNRLGRRSVLVLLDIEGSVARNNIYHVVLMYGIQLHRIVFVGKQAWTNHLHRAGGCDVILDTFVYGAHTTCSDMLWMGVPVMALEGISCAL